MSTVARLTLSQYDRMIEAGVFECGAANHVELIRGEIRQMSPIGPEHEEVVDRLTSWSFAVLPASGTRVRVQNSIGLPGLKSAPQPDVVWVVERNYSRERPAAEDVLLVIEVAESSLAYDRGEKAELYADAGLSDYWIVNLPERSIEVRRDPQAGHYRSLQTFTGNDDVCPLAMPEAILRPASLGLV